MTFVSFFPGSNPALCGTPGAGSGNVWVIKTISINKIYINLQVIFRTYLKKVLGLDITIGIGIEIEIGELGRLQYQYRFRSR